MSSGRFLVFVALAIALLAERGEHQMSQAIDAKVAECQDMAMKARLKVESASSPEELCYWQKVEERWTRVAQIYQDTKG